MLSRYLRVEGLFCKLWAPIVCKFLSKRFMSQESVGGKVLRKLLSLALRPLLKRLFSRQLLTYYYPLLTPVLMVIEYS